MLATATPEQPIPHTGAFVGEGIGLRCGSFDLGAGCAGFVYALVAGASMLTAGALDHVLVVGAETLSRIVNPQDRSTCILFGDGSAGVVLGRARTTTGPACSPGTSAATAPRPDCSRSARVEAGGRRARRRSPPKTSTCGWPDKRSSGARSGSSWTPRCDPGTRRRRRGGRRLVHPPPGQPPDHRSRKQRLGIPSEKTIVNIDRYGNTSAASIPLALTEAAEDGRLQPGQLVLVSGFGAGMAWASALLRWGTP